MLSVSCSYRSIVYTFVLLWALTFISYMESSFSINGCRSNIRLYAQMIGTLPSMRPIWM